MLATVQDTSNGPVSFVGTANVPMCVVEQADPVRRCSSVLRRSIPSVYSRNALRCCCCTLLRTVLCCALSSNRPIDGKPARDLFFQRWVSMSLEILAVFGNRHYGLDAVRIENTVTEKGVVGGLVNSLNLMLGDVVSFPFADQSSVFDFAKKCKRRLD